MGSPPLLRRHPANGFRLAALLAVPVALAAAGLTVMATLQPPAADPDPTGDRAATLRSRVAASPQDASAWAALGTLVLGQAADSGDPRRYPDADAALGRSLRLRPDGNPAALSGLAALRTVQRRYVEAQDLARRALALSSDDPGVWGTLADAASGLGRYDEARAAVGHMLDRRVDVAALTRSAALDEAVGRVEVARATLERAVDAATSPAETAQAHAALADLAFATGDPAEAFRQTGMARTADPDQPDLLAAQATAEAALGRTPAALADYTAVVDGAAALVDGAAPTAPPATVVAAAPTAAPASDAGGGGAARAAAGLAVGGRRTVAPRYLVAAGELFEAVGRTADARRAYAAFTAIADLFATNGVPLAPEPALFAADRGEPDQALRLAEAAVRAGPTTAAQDAYAWALMANGRAVDALAWSDRATSAGARNAVFAFHRGMIESSLGRDRAARDDLATALRTNPWFSPRLAPLARVALTALAGPQ